VTLDQAVALVADKKSKGKPGRQGPAKKPRPSRQAKAKATPRSTKAKGEAESEISSEIMSLRNPGKAAKPAEQLPSEAEVLDYVRSRPGG
jgi:hypothetical protein